MTRRTVVCVDLDDTLYAECDYALSALHFGGEWFRVNAGLNHVGENARACFLAGSKAPLQDTLRHFGYDLPEYVVSAGITAIREHQPKIAPFAEIPRALEALASRSNLVLVTEGRSVTQRAKLNALGLTPLFNDIIITEELQTGMRKESGAPYAAVLERHPVAKHYVMIGDNPIKDIRPSVSLGFKPFLVRRPLVAYTHACSEAAYSSLDEIVPLLERLYFSADDRSMVD